ncbi:MAG: hypothetical protein WDZ69_03190 [Candidatus Pacearchaeota archaeon]
MNEEELIRKITEKRDFSHLPAKDVELAFSHFENRQVSDKEKVRLTRELLHKVFGAFGSRKLLSLKDKSPEWILRKHLSTRERMDVPSSSRCGQTRERIGFYDEIYKKILEKEKVVLDLGAGINGFSYDYFPRRVRYVAAEAVGQWVDLMNDYFRKEKIDGKAVHLSLFELEKVKELIKKEKGSKKDKVVFLFKVLDSLEMLERDYSKKLLSEIAPLVSKVVLSFATESMNKRKRFKVGRGWILNYIKENFSVVDDFEIGSERFVVFCKR